MNLKFQCSVTSMLDASLVLFHTHTSCLRGRSLLCLSKPLLLSSFVWFFSVLISVIAGDYCSPVNIKVFRTDFMFLLSSIYQFDAVPLFV